MGKTKASIEFVKDYIDKRMSAVEEIMKKHTGAECRKNVWETISNLKEDYPCYIDYIDIIYKELVERYNTDFFEDIR